MNLFAWCVLLPSSPPDLCNCLTTLVITWSLLSPNSGTVYPVVGGGGAWARTCLNVLHCLHVHTVQLWRPEMSRRSSGRGDHNSVWGGGVKFICTQKWCMCVGPGPPSLMLYQLTPTPHPRTRTQRRKKRARAWLSSFLPSFLFSPSPFCCLCCHKIYCILWGQSIS